MNPDTLTLSDLAKLSLILELAAHDIKAVRLRAMDGQIGPDEAVDLVTAILAKLPRVK